MQNQIVQSLFCLQIAAIACMISHNSEIFQYPKILLCKKASMVKFIIYLETYLKWIILEWAYLYKAMVDWEEKKMFLKVWRLTNSGELMLCIKKKQELERERKHLIMNEYHNRYGINQKIVPKGRSFCSLVWE